VFVGVAIVLALSAFWAVLPFCGCCSRGTHSSGQSALVNGSSSRFLESLRAERPAKGGDNDEFSCISRSAFVLLGASSACLAPGGLALPDCLTANAFGSKGSALAPILVLLRVLSPTGGFAWMETRWAIAVLLVTAHGRP